VTHLYLSKLLNGAVVDLLLALEEAEGDEATLIIGRTVYTRQVWTIPVVGSIVGGIVGGFVGSKVAKFVTGLFGKKKNQNVVANGNEITVANGNVVSGNVVNGNVTMGGSAEIPVACAPAISASGEAISSTLPGSKVKVKDPAVAKRIQEIEDEYYRNYLEYNRLLQENDIEGAKAVFQNLKKCTDEVSALRKAIK
ncbi:MAG: hypothetical protein II567_14110, partial [Candidatus Riflebacteria bacterium]|nr:hypothetical protein [Candidatus Riflebacteria bacterium]